MMLRRLAYKMSLAATVFVICCSNKSHAMPHNHRALEDFQPWIFEEQVSKTFRTLRKLLDGTRNIQLAEHEDHTYNDKFSLAEFVTRSTWRSLLGVFSRIGLAPTLLVDTAEYLQQQQQEEANSGPAGNNRTTRDSSAKERVFLYFDQTRTYVSLGKHMSKVKDSEVDTTLLGVRVGSTASYHNVVEYHWTVTEKYELHVCIGSSLCKDDSDAKRVSVRGRTMSSKIRTTTDQPPAYNSTVSETLEMTWFARMQRVASDGNQRHFSIDRSVESCKTPRRNADIQAVFRFHKSLYNWLGSAMICLETITVAPGNDHLTLGSRGIDTNKPDFGLLTLPLMENSTMLSIADTDSMFNHEMKAMDVLIDQIGHIYPPANTKDGDDKPMQSVEEASLYLYLARSRSILENYSQSIGYLENMIRNQLTQALGKELTSTDFEHYMHFHNRKFLGNEYAPKPFSRSIRLDDNQNPVGTIMIETIHSHEPIQTMSRRIQGNSSGEGTAPSIKIPLDASSSVQITGDRYIHGWLRHQFLSPTAMYGAAGPGISLVARARQFSSFMLIVGTMTGADTFDPKHAIILQNKDELLIPLIIETLPSVKEFRDAIASLSPEQQTFAKAFRTMQLESSVFAVCIVQLKPQLEKLLHLSKGSLAKEIQLTEDLMSLFVEYQIPSDIVSYDGHHGEEVTPTEKVQIVKGYVKSVIQVIEARKESQYDSEDQNAGARQNMMGNPVPCGSNCFRKPPTDEPNLPHMTPTKSRSPNPKPHFGTSTATPITGSPGATSTDSPVPSPPSGVFPGQQPHFPTPPPSPSPSSSPSKSRSQHASMNEKVGNPTQRYNSYSETTETGSATSSKDNVAQEFKEKVTEGASTQLRETPVRSDDFTLIPQILDDRLQELDTADGVNQIKPTIVKPQPQAWQLRRQPNLLVKQMTFHTMSQTDIDLERNQAMDLLDALSRSGTLAIESAELHVVIGATYCFEHSIMATLVEDNINPIVKADLATLLLGSTIYGEPVQEILGNSTGKANLVAAMPSLFSSSSLPA